MRARLVCLLVFLAGCSGDGPGNNDTVLTGFSGLVIVVIAFLLVARWIKRRDRK